MEYIRVSASYIFNIKLDEKYLLVKSERRNQYQPIGGCYKYFKKAEKFLFSLGALPEKKSNGVDSLMDLRLLVPQENIKVFIEWFISGQNRETTYFRELNEELVSLLPQNKQKFFNEINVKNQKNGSFDVFFDEEKSIKSIKPMDVISIELTNIQKQVILELCTNNQFNFILATKEDILNGYKLLKDKTKVKIGSHTKNILN